MSSFPPTRMWKSTQRCMQVNLAEDCHMQHAQAMSYRSIGRLLCTRGQKGSGQRRVGEADEGPQSGRGHAGRSDGRRLSGTLAVFLPLLQNSSEAACVKLFVRAESGIVVPQCAIQFFLRLPISRNHERCLPASARCLQGLISTVINCALGSCLHVDFDAAISS